MRLVKDFGTALLRLLAGGGTKKFRLECEILLNFKLNHYVFSSLPNASWVKRFLSRKINQISIKKLWKKCFQFRRNQ
jgi:hypothetical protein